MPIKRCTLPGGGQGWQYGSQKCYASKKDAIKQMIAIKSSGYKESKAQLCKAEEITEEELYEVLAEMSLEENILINLKYPDD